MSLLGSLPCVQEQLSGIKIKKAKKQVLGRGAPEEQAEPSGKGRGRRETKRQEREEHCLP